MPWTKMDREASKEEAFLTMKWPLKQVGEEGKLSDQDVRASIQ